MVKIGVRTPSIKRSVKARTTGRITRTVKRSVNPVYGKKGTGFITNPERSIKNAVYHRTTVGINPLSTLATNQSKSSTIAAHQTQPRNDYEQPISIHELPSDFVQSHNIPKNKLLLEINDVKTEDHEKNINELISNISGDVERYELYSDLKRNDIIDFHFGEKIYQFDFFTIDIHTDSEVIRNNGVYELRLKDRLSNTFLTIGAIPSDYNEQLDSIFSDKSVDTELQIKTYGGNYKQTSENKNGSISVRNYKEPLRFVLQIYDTNPRKKAEQAVINDYYKALQDQQDAADRQTSKSVGGCMAIGFIAFLIIIAVISSIFN